jgi:hypothetical protein
VGSYGSTVGTYSPWNSVSANPPEFFNQDKSSSYGKFTVNTATANRTTVSSLTNIIDYFNNNSQDIGATRTNACSSATAFTQASQRSLLKTNRTSINVSMEPVRLTLLQMGCSPCVIYSVYRAIRLLMELWQVMLLERLQRRLRRT